MMNFQFKDFDGPLDLLLQMITKEQVDIKDIFVSRITDQYIDYVHHMQFIDMEDATDFLVMAATLLEIKSRSMLPRPPQLEEGETDPEEELIRRLEEYKRFRETAGALKEFEAAAAGLFSKLPDEFPLPPQETELVGLDMEGLMAALQRVLLRKPEADTAAEVNHYAARDIHRDEHNVQDCMLSLLKKLRNARTIRFEEAFSESPTREEVVTMFMALLELLRLGEMHMKQDRICGEIYLMHGRAPEIVEEEQENGQGPAGRRRRNSTSGGKPERED